MKNNLYIVIAVAVGIIIGGLEFYEVYTVYQDHQTITSVVSFLNQQIDAAQKQQQAVTVAPVPSK